jgi:hypothetical protein
MYRGKWVTNMNAKQMALPELKNIFRGLQGKIAIS